jgi:hypothetical protein
MKALAISAKLITRKPIMDPSLPLMRSTFATAGSST